MFHSRYSVSLCYSVFCLCVNVCCTTATGCQPICSWQIYHIYHIIWGGWNSTGIGLSVSSLVFHCQCHFTRAVWSTYHWHYVIFCNLQQHKTCTQHTCTHYFVCNWTWKSNWIIWCNKPQHTQMCKHASSSRTWRAQPWRWRYCCHFKCEKPSAG